MQTGESLLVCCKAFQPECKKTNTLTLPSKNSSTLIRPLRIGRDDYSLNIVNLPHDENVNDNDIEDELYNEDESEDENVNTETNNNNKPHYLINHESKYF